MSRRVYPSGQSARNDHTGAAEFRAQPLTDLQRVLGRAANPTIATTARGRTSTSPLTQITGGGSGMQSRSAG